jgi:hypothetical protein
VSRRLRRHHGPEKPAPAWPTARRSLARKVTYGLVFLWVSLAGHLVLIYGSRRAGSPGATSPLAPFVLDLSKADEDPVARWIGERLGPMLERAAPVQTTATAPISSATAAPISSAVPAPTTTAGVLRPVESGDRP